MKKILSVFLSMVLVLSGVSLVRYYQEGSEEYNVSLEVPEETSQDSDEGSLSSEMYLNEPKELTILPELEEMYNQNNDMVGWIDFSSIGISYPIMWTPSDVQFYLRKSFDKKYSKHGTLFIDADEGLNDTTVILYGHNMADNTQFGNLDVLLSEEVLQNNRTFVVSDLYNKYQYEIISVILDRVYYNTDECFKYYFYNGNDTSKFDEFISWIEIKSVVTPNLGGITEETKILMLSTCSYHVTDGRLIVVAKRVDNITLPAIK